MRHRVRRRAKDPGELNITAFMNLMVVLVPFLLITAVFSRLAIVELNLPESSASSSPSKRKEFRLEVVIWQDSLDVRNANGGLIKRIRSSSKGYDLKQLSQVLRQLKNRYPDKQDAMILAQPDTSYNTLVQVMDKIRMVTVVKAKEVTHYELFPNISIGDAPKRRT